MHKTTNTDSKSLQFIIIVMALLNIYAITNIIDPTLYGRFFYIFTPGVIFWMLSKHYTIPKLYWIILLSLSLVVIFQNIIGVQSPTSINGSVFTRITPLFILVAIRAYKGNLKIVQYFGLAFYVIECCISIYEKISLTHIIDYSLAEDLQATSQVMEDDGVFRSFSLMFHPLFNANVVALFLAFIICNKDINLLSKTFLFVLGIGALWGFNSRAALMIFTIILIYRFFLYYSNIWKILISLILLYFLLPVLFEWLLISGYLGRLEGFDFSDSSTLTRVEAWFVFFNYGWSVKDIFIGGRLLTYSGLLDDVTLENGVLLDLGYWGIFAGLIKVFGEIIISYTVLDQYSFKDKLIIMIAMWGIAFMNNNSHMCFLMAMFVLGYATFVKNNRL